MSRGPTHFSSDEEGEDVLVTEAHYLPGANFLSYTPVISNTHLSILGVDEKMCDWHGTRHIIVS